MVHTEGRRLCSYVGFLPKHIKILLASVSADEKRTAKLWRFLLK